MPNASDKPIQWRPRIRLWHVFALVTLSAVLVWMWPRLGLQLDYQPGKGSRAAIVWSGDVVEIWNTWPPPAAVSWTTITIPGPNGPVKSVVPLVPEPVVVSPPEPELHYLLVGFASLPSTSPGV